ncbi:DNA topoisomerase III [Bacillus coahuilensis]|uniref:DNA topoisomerase III n=1 Tax=Bacillus coahuilensis TaxID=408580 RepID=UPI0001851470|nr:DNA topoisomerase III [Bacillus coahuilensis]
MKTLVLAEKPSVGRDIAKVLGCTNGGNGFLEGSNYIVTWALGHLVTLADPEAYDQKYKTWNIEDLPMLPSSLRLVTIKKTGKQFSTVKAQLHRKDVKDIVIATDAGREGELVARWILDKVKIAKPVKRLWISSVTDQAIKKGFEQLKDGRDYQNLYHSAVARAEADWYVGLNATRALTVKHNAQLSCGRVQTPTLAMIAQRDQEIRSFNPTPFYELSVVLDGVTFKWQDGKNQSTRSFHKERIEALLTKLKGKEATIQSLQRKEKKQYAPNLYDLTELQRDAHKRFGFSAKETLSTLQRLYEQHKAVTYPRTDSTYLTSDLVDTLGERVSACSGIKEYRPYTSKIKGPFKLGKQYVNDALVSDHHAIIPTEVTPIESKLSDKERKIYDLVVTRFLSILLPPYRYEEVKATLAIDGETFIAKETKDISLGFKVITSTSTQTPSAFTWNEGDRAKSIIVHMTEGQTEPPAPYNEGTLLTAMENPTGNIEDKELKETLSKTGGLGTVATRADIIEKLFNSFLIEKRGNSIFPTSKGKQLLQLAPEKLTSPVLTAEWELKLEAIAKGKLKISQFMNEIKEYTEEAVAEIKKSNEKFKHDNVTGSKCPECNSLLLEINGKNGKIHVCQDRNCGYKKNIAKKTNARCPQCKKKLELRGEGDGQIFVCTCGHREKLSAFQKRKKNSSNSKATKRDVNQFMKKQDSEPVNTALADALAKLKLDNK